MVKQVSKATDKKPEPTTEADASVKKIRPTAKKIRNATGTDEPSLQMRMINQAMAAVWLREGQDADDAINATLAALEAIAPTDGLEGMLATQMVATHETALECLRRAMLPNQSFEGRDVNLKHAAKLMQIYARQVESLDKHRGRGQQKITVEHVNVHAGGQAIVGTVQAPAAAAAKTATGPLAIADQTGDLVPLPDPLAACRRVKQATPRISNDDEGE